MIDSHDRVIDYIRVSVTDRCNLRCAYCMPKEGVRSIPHNEVLTLEEVLRLCTVFAGLGIGKIKVTGGEPLIRGGVTRFMGELKRVPGIEKVTVTTNGTVLEEKLPALVEAGIDCVNVSLDTLDADVFKRLTGTDSHAAVMRAIDACARVLPVKVNCVPIAGVNEHELVKIAELARERVSAVRFIELMPVGLGVKYGYISSARTAALMCAAYGDMTPVSGVRLGSGPAEYYSIRGFNGYIGLINAISHEFCHKCNRVRLTADGRLKLCLSHETGVNLKPALRAGASDAELARIITDAVAQKPRGHCFACAAPPTAMNSIGG